jgi:3',5'-cyclic AMP phosphodiesterase CpdA
MSDVFDRHVSRRQFLSFGLAVAGGVITLRPRRALSAEPMVPRKATRWAFLSDIHIASTPKNHFHGHYPYRNLQKALEQVTGDLPDGVVITGDLARWKGGIAAYDNVQTMLAPVAAKRPVHLGLGNHDNRDDFLSAFGVRDENGVRNKHIVTANVGPVRMIILDSLLYTNVYGGMIGKNQRIWLDTYLRLCDDTPTVLFLHHAPRADLLDAGRLLEIAAPAKKVKAIVYGHSHKYDYREYEGIHLVNLPATGYNFTNAQPVGWVEARLTGEGGEFTLHAVGGSRKYDGHTVALPWRA